MRHAAQSFAVICGAALALLDAAAHAQGQPAANARRLSVLDRRGQPIFEAQEDALYSQPAFSHDGIQLAVLKMDPQTRTQDIWIIGVDDATSRRITTGALPGSTPTWSPDGHSLAFASYRPPAGWGIYRVRPDGSGAEETLYRHTGFGGVSSVEWADDGRSIYFSDLINISGALYRLPLDGTGRAIEILRPPVFAPHISPDGRWIAYQSNQSGRNEVYVKQLIDSRGNATAPPLSGRQVSSGGGAGMVAWRQDGRELFYLSQDSWVMSAAIGDQADVSPPLRLFQAPSTVRSPGTPGANNLAAVSPDGGRFAFVVPPAPSVQKIAVLDRNGENLRTVGAPGLYSQPSLSFDETHIAFVSTDPESGNVDICVLDLSTQRIHSLTMDPPVDSAPVWSPDGKYVAFVSNRGDYAGIYRRRSSGHGEEELLYQHTAGTQSVVLTDWSADGRFLAFHSGDVLYVLPLDGSRQPMEVVRDEFSSVGGRFSPDGRYLAYLSDRSGRYELYVRPVSASPSDRLVQVSRGGAQGMIFWRHDGKEIGYLSKDGDVTVVGLASPAPEVADDPKSLFRAPIASGGAYGATGNSAQLHNVNADANRFVFAVPASPR